MNHRWNHARRMGINPTPTLEPRQEDGDKPHPYIGTIRMYDWNHPHV